MICDAALARPTPTVSTKSFETSSQKLNNSGISAHPTLRTIKKVNRMEAFFTDCLSLGSFRSQFVWGLVKSNALSFITVNLPRQHGSDSFLKMHQHHHHGSPSLAGCGKTRKTCHSKPRSVFERGEESPFVLRFLANSRSLTRK